MKRRRLPAYFGAPALQLSTGLRFSLGTPSWVLLLALLVLPAQVFAQPPAPVAQSPGTASAPGQLITDTTPSLQWSASSGAAEYDVYVSRKSGTSYIVIFDSEVDYTPAITGTTVTLPAGVITTGSEYRWTMRAKNAAGYSLFSNTLYFYLTGSVDRAPVV